MKYTVKNEHGELTFDSLAHLRQMLEQGLVEGTDQVREEGSTVWRQVAAIPELQHLTRDRSGEQRWILWGAVTGLSLSGALYALVKVHSWIAAAALMLPVLIMSQRAFVAATRKRRG
jgi:hypothetical protein